MKWSFAGLLLAMSLFPPSCGDDDESNGSGTVAECRVAVGTDAIDANNIPEGTYPFKVAGTGGNRYWNSFDLEHYNLSREDMEEDPNYFTWVAETYVAGNSGKMTVVRTEKGYRITIDELKFGNCKGQYASGFFVFEGTFL